MAHTLNAILTVRLNYKDDQEYRPEHRVHLPKPRKVSDFFTLGPYTTRLEEYFVIFEDPSEDLQFPVYIEETPKIARVLTALKDNEDRTRYPTPERLAAAIKTSRGEYGAAQALDADVYKAVMSSFVAHIELRRREGITVHSYKQKRIHVSPEQQTIRVEGPFKNAEAFDLTGKLLRSLPPLHDYRDLARQIDKVNIF